MVTHWLYAPPTRVETPVGREPSHSPIFQEVSVEPWVTWSVRQVVETPAQIHWFQTHWRSTGLVDLVSALRHPAGLSLQTPVCEVNSALCHTNSFLLLYPPMSGWRHHSPPRCASKTSGGHLASTACEHLLHLYPHHQPQVPLFLLIPPKRVPCGSAGKEFTCNAGNLGSMPGLGRSPGEGKGNPLQYAGLENSKDCMGSQRVGHDWATELNWMHSPGCAHCSLSQPCSLAQVIMNHSH